MNHVKRMRTVVRAMRNKDGSVLPMFAVSALVLIGAVAASLDFGVAYSHYTKLQHAADSSALAAATLADALPAQRQARGAATFNANYEEAAEAKFKLNVNDPGPDQGGFVTAIVDRTLKTNFLSLFGYPEIDLNVTARAPLPRLLETEIVFVLDYSDSMIDNDKSVRMAEAAARMIDTVSLNGQNSRARFAVVPFAAMVKVDLPPYAVRGDVSYTGCTQDRRAPYNGEETAPAAGDESRWGEVTSTHDCAEMGNLGLDVIPLTNDHNLVKTKIAGMKPYLWTHIAAGAEIGWQTISPNKVIGDAKPYDTDERIKVMVLLTDGMQTAPGWGADGTQSAAHGEKNLLSLCTGMKDRKIKVFTIGYDLTDQHTKDLLKDCADSGRFYDAEDIDSGLLAAFGEIGVKIRTAMFRLTK